MQQMTSNGSSCIQDFLMCSTPFLKTNLERRIRVVMWTTRQKRSGMDTPPKANSVEDVFRPAFEEIARRSGVTKDFEHEEVTFFQTTSTFSMPFELPSQNFFLITMGTAVLAPRPKDAERPALRIYGAFETKDEAVEHAEVVRQVDVECSLIVVKRNEWILMPSTEESRDDSEVNQKRLDRVLSDWDRGHLCQKEAFKKRLETKDGGPEMSSSDVVDPEEEAEMKEAEAIVYKPPRRLRVGCEVRGQNAVCLCIIPQEFGECAIRLLGCFETTEEANQWSSNVACRQIVHNDVLVASCCEWLYPNGEQKAVHKYRVDELQRIMDSAERNPVAVKNYKEWKREQDALKNENQIEEVKDENGEDNVAE